LASYTSQYFCDATKITFVIGYTKFAFFFFLVAKIIEINLQNKSFRDFFASYRVFLVKKTKKNKEVLKISYF